METQTARGENLDILLHFTTICMYVRNSPACLKKTKTKLQDIYIIICTNKEYERA